MSRTKRTKAVIAAEENTVIGNWRVDRVVEGSTRQVYATCLPCGTEEVRCIYDLTRKRASGNQSCRKCANAGIIRRNKLSPGEALISGEFHSYQKAARRRGYSFELSREEFREFIFSQCHYCGSEPSRRLESSWDSILVNGVDRVSNELGYQKRNCVPCCKECNYAKRDMTTNEYINLCKRVAERWK